MDNITKKKWYKITREHIVGTALLTGERAQTIFRGRPRGRLGSEGSGNGRVRGRPRRFGSTQAGGATWYRNNSTRLQRWSVSPLALAGVCRGDPATGQGLLSCC